MSPFDVPPDEMGTDPDATDDALDRMLSDGAPADDEWRDVALFVQELQEAVPSADLASEDLHVAAMVETASRLPKQRRKPMKSIVAKVLAPIAAVLTVFGGMAYAGALPSGSVSHAVGTVSVGLSSDDGTTDAPGEDDQGESSDEATSDDQGENDDSQGDDDNQGEDTQDDGSDENSGDDQGDTTQSDDQSGDSQSGDSQSGDSQGDSQD
jgi:hypothetical protein